jgi:hypothetical protein
VWKRRFFVLQAGYLFRFASPTGRAKGTPVPVESALIEELDEDDEESGGRPCIRVGTLRAMYVLAAPTREAAGAWAADLRAAKDQASGNCLSGRRAGAPGGRAGGQRWHSVPLTSRQDAVSSLPLPPGDQGVHGACPEAS